MTRTVHLNLDKHLIPPAAIYLWWEGGVYFTYGCAYESTTWPFWLLDKLTNPYFKYCQDCRYNQLYQSNHPSGCPGGHYYLSGTNLDQARVIETAGGRKYVPEVQRNCIKVNLGEISYDPYNLLHKVQLPVPIPTFAVMSEYYGRTGNQCSAWVLQGEDENGHHDLWKGSPFILGNVAADGYCCLGSASYKVRDYQYDTLINAFLTFERNNDYLGTYRDKYKTLAEFGRALMFCESNLQRLELINSLSNDRYRYFRRDICKYNLPDYHRGNRFILPPIYEKIEFNESANNPEFFVYDKEGKKFKLVPNPQAESGLGYEVVEEQEQEVINEN